MDHKPETGVTDKNDTKGTTKNNKTKPQNPGLGFYTMTDRVLS